MQARVVHRGRHVRQMGALPPVRQRIRMIEERGTFPEIGVVEECRHRPLEVIRQRRKLLDEGAVGVFVPGEMPGRFVDDGSAAFLTAQFGDVSELRVHRVALGVVQIKPCREQRVGLGLLHRGEVEVAEDTASVEIAGQQTVRHLPEEVAGGSSARAIQMPACAGRAPYARRNRGTMSASPLSPSR